MSFAFVNGYGASTSGSGSVITTSSVSVAAGQLVVVLFRWEGRGNSQVAGTVAGGGLAWSAPVYACTTSGEDEQIAMSYAVADAGGSISVTFTASSGTVSYIGWQVGCFTFSGGVQLVDSASSQRGSDGGTWSTGSFEASDGDLSVIGHGNYNSAASPTPSNLPSGFSLVHQQSGGSLNRMYRRIYSDSHSGVVTTTTGGSDSYVAVVLVFRETGGGGNHDVDIPEIVTVGDLGAAQFAPVANLSETAVAADSVGQVFWGSAQIVDAVVLSEGAVGVAVSVLHAQEPVLPLESAIAAPLFVAAMGEPVLASVQALATPTLLAALSEALAAADVSAGASDDALSMAEAVVAIDSLSGSPTLIRALLEPVVASAQALAVSTLLVALSEALAPADVSAGAADGDLALTETVFATDSLSGSPTLIRALLEPVAASVSSLATPTLLAALSEALAANDAADLLTGGDVVIGEAVAASEQALKTLAAVAAVVEAHSVGDGYRVIEDVVALLTEAIALGDLMLTIKALTWLPSSDRVAKVLPVARIANVVEKQWM